MDKTVLSYLNNTVKLYPDKICCIDDNERITFKELDELSDVAAYNLIKLIPSRTPVPLIMKKKL